MDLKELKTYLGEDWTKVEQQIKLSLDSDIDYLNTTNALILSHSGKQLRALLSILIARACSGGQINEASVRYAASAEILHNATLLHDDVADNSDYRRGAPTILSLMGASVSVLVGDYWLVKAMETVLGRENAGTEADNRVIRLFAKTLSDLASGEMLQLQKAGSGDTDEADYERIIYSKTASLFEVAARTAAISVKAIPEVEKAMATYAIALGMAFQIRDDIFDYSPAALSVGKPVGVDILEQKITLPLLGAFKNRKERENELRAMVNDIGEHQERRDEILAFVKEAKGIEYATARLEAYIEEAVAALDCLPESREKSYLKELAYFVGKRVS